MLSFIVHKLFFGYFRRKIGDKNMHDETAECGLGRMQDGKKYAW
jgi:hypothetical protein